MSKVTIDQLTDVLVKRIALSMESRSESGGDSCTPTIRISIARRQSDQGPPVLYTELRYDVDKNLSARILRKVLKGLEELEPLAKTRNNKQTDTTSTTKWCRLQVKGSNEVEPTLDGRDSTRK
jgi:predicted transcriptional regulator